MPQRTGPPGCQAAKQGVHAKGCATRRDSSGNVYDYFVDAIGSTRAVTNSTGGTCFNADYCPYGQENDYNTSCSPAYKFTGYD